MEPNNQNIQIITAPTTALEKIKNWATLHLLLSGAIFNGILFKTYIYPYIFGGK